MWISVASINLHYILALPTHRSSATYTSATLYISIINLTSTLSPPGGGAHKWNLIKTADPKWKDESTQVCLGLLNSSGLGL